MTLTELKKLHPSATIKTWHKHPKGGGWVENTATVADSAYVGECARVYGNARVYGSTQVSDNTQVSGDARVSDNAWVYGNAQVYGNARVSGDAQVSGDARVYGDARVSGDAWVYGGQIRSVVPTYSTTYVANPAKPGFLRIGCEVHTFNQWRDHGLSIASARGEGEWYTQDIMPVLEHLIAQCERLFEGQEVKK